MVDNDSPGLLIIHGEDEPCSDDECGTNSARSVSFDTTEINADIQNLHSPLTPSGEENLRPLASEQGETVPAPQPPPPLLSPPRQLYDSSHDSLVSQEVLVDIIENTDLKKKNSIKTELYRRALPQLRFTNQHPKPPNHIIAQNTWEEAIISIVLFGRLRKKQNTIPIKMPEGIGLLSRLFVQIGM